MFRLDEDINELSLEFARRQAHQHLHWSRYFQVLSEVLELRLKRSGATCTRPYPRLVST